MKKIKFIISMSLVFLLSSCGVKIDTHASNKDLKNATESTIKVDINKSSIASIDIKNIKKQLTTLEKELAADNSKDAILKHLNNFNENSGLNASSIFFGDESGNFYVTPAVELPADYDPRIRPWYKATKEDGEYISDVYIDLLTNNKILTIGKAIYKDKELIGVAAIDLIVEIIN